jgi:hypothetical protein
MQALALFFLILLTGLMLFHIAMRFAEWIMNEKFSIHSIFKDFRQKMWMTVGLGTLFLSLYLIVVLLGSSVVDSQVRLNFFFLVYRHPVAFIYLGLLIFACISISIYIARLAIKYFYNTRNKD